MRERITEHRSAKKYRREKSQKSHFSCIWERLARWVLIGILSYKIWLEEYLWDTSSRIDSIVGGS